jgi:hypothetical protein
VFAVVRFRRSKRLKWHAAAVMGAVSVVMLADVPRPASAGIFDFLFGAQQQSAPPPPAVNAYAEPAAPATRTRADLDGVQIRGGGRFVAFCVRLCDGQHFPLAQMPNATPIETCRAMCPASKTEIFFGTGIDHAVARDGARYADLDNAFVYRQRLVPNCTCNGKDAFGLASYDLSTDPTLRPGDVVATSSGFKVYAGKRGQGDTFTPVDAVTIHAEMNGGSAGAHLARAGKEPAVADEELGISVPAQADIHTALRGQAAR